MPTPWLLRSLAGAATALVMQLLFASPSMAIQTGSRIPWLGGSWYLQGADYPWDNYGNDFGANVWGAYGVHSSATNAIVDADFAKMAAEGIHVTRWFVFTDGRAGITFAAELPTGLDTYVFQDLDAAVQIAAKHDIYLNLVLLDFSWMSNAQTVNGVQLGGHANVINTASGQQALINNVFVPVFQRYAHNPQIISWEVMNEPEWAIIEDGAVNGNIGQPSSLANFQSFTTQVAAAVHANTQSYVTVGEASMKWALQWKGLGLDFYQIHYYDWMQPYPITNLYGATYGSLGLDRPVVVGEFPAGGSATATLQQYLDTWFNNGYAGTWGWSYKGVDANGVPAPTVMSNWASAHASAINIAPTSVVTISSLAPNMGPVAGGTSVTIAGTNFSAVTGVKFGASDAVTFTANSTTQITASSPPGSGTVDVTVTAAGGTSATSAADRFTYAVGVSAGGVWTSGPDADATAANSADAFIRGTDNALWYSHWNGVAFSGFTSIGGVLTADPGVASQGLTRTDVFARGGDNQLYQKHWNGSVWSAWSALGGILTMGPRASLRAGTPAHVDVWVAGSDGQLYHKWSDDGGNTFGNWQALGGFLTSDPNAISWSSNRVDVFVRGSDNQLYHKFWDISIGWSSWEALGGILTSAPDVASCGVGHLDVFVRGTDNGIWQKGWNGSAWSAWIPRGGTWTSSPAAVCRQGTQMIDVFIRGTDNALWTEWFPAS